MSVHIYCIQFNGKDKKIYNISYGGCDMCDASCSRG